MFAVFMGVYLFVTDSHAGPSALLSAAIGGIIFGAFMGPIRARQTRRQRAATGDLAPRELRIAYRAAWRGPRPADPEIRSAAARAAAHVLETTLRQRLFSVIIFGVCTVMSLFFVVDSPWWLLATGLYGAFLAAQWYWPRRLRRRVELLTAGDRS